MRKVSRRSFLARVAGAGVAAGALGLVTGEARAFQETDSDSGAKGRSRRPRPRPHRDERRRSRPIPAGYGRPHSGCTDSDSGANSDPAGRGRCATGESDSDSGANADAAGHGRPRTGITDGDSGARSDPAGRGRGSGMCNDRDRGPAPIRPAAAGAASGVSEKVSFRERFGFPSAGNLLTLACRRCVGACIWRKGRVADETDTQTEPPFIPRHGRGHRRRRGRDRRHRRRSGRGLPVRQRFRAERRSAGRRRRRGGSGCTDSDTGSYSDPAGNGRCRRRVRRSGCTDSDTGRYSDPAGNGRCVRRRVRRSGCTDADTGRYSDPAGNGRCVRRSPPQLHRFGRRPLRRPAGPRPPLLAQPKRQSSGTTGARLARCRSVRARRCLHQVRAADI